MLISFTIVIYYVYVYQTMLYTLNTCTLYLKYINKWQINKSIQVSDSTGSQTWLHMEIYWTASKSIDVWIPIYRLYSYLIVPIMSFKGNFFPSSESLIAFSCHASLISFK